MAERPYIDLSTSDVYRKAQTAARRGDAETFNRSVDELRSRKRGEDLVEELQDFRARTADRDLPDALKNGFRVGDVQDLTLLVDDDCHRRLDLFRKARRSIWLSTFTVKDGAGDLREILAERARNRVSVNLIVSPGPLKPGRHAEEVLEDLREARVRVTVRTNHSKCVVVDEEHVMIGSANLHADIYRDVGLQFRSASVARVLIDYMQAVARSTR